MKKHTLRFRAVNKDIFEAIRTGKKTVETRAATTKYANIQAGDMLVLVCGSKKFEKTIAKATHFKSVRSMLKKYKIGDIHPTARNTKELISIYHSFPGYEEKLEQSGIIAFELS